MVCCSVSMDTYDKIPRSTVSGVAIGNNAVKDAVIKCDEVNMQVLTFKMPDLTLMKLLISLLISALRSAFFSFPL